ncbi:EAL domain-containing protein [Desulfobulbus rhabdoformis]|uniref:sensor domain-containing protein n=1 Tax=Desulfobulbus rhabdoformis TaxID=34032 RepID=UPI0019627936|nr:EAL domain-containing protein [Desulfobulbus rhabdoformis]MBM9616674.1 EAL domain-containing protein [Desulfobulbus rhabdoformis]
MAQKHTSAHSTNKSGLLAQIVNSSPVATFVINQAHEVIHWNRACVMVTGVSEKQLIGTTKSWKPFYDHHRPVMADLIVDDQMDQLSTYYPKKCHPSTTIEGAWEAEDFFPHFPGGGKWLAFTATALKDEKSGAIIGAIETLRDITAQKIYQQQLEHQANYDHLTGLANRHLLHTRLELAISQAERDHLLLGVLFLDLDNFKQINDTLGHDAGDDVIREFGGRLKTSVRDLDTVARIAGDEYVVLLYAPQNIVQVTTIVRRLLDAINHKFTVREREIYIGASVGIALYPKDGKDSQTLLSNADAAMFRAKQHDKGSFRFYTEDLNKDALQWLELKQELHYALTSGQLELYYQPQYSIQEKRITGAEALLRWNHPTRGLLHPELFIALAEETGLIVPIGNWIIKTAISDARQWQEAYGQPLRLSINISARQFRYDELDELLDQAITQTGFHPLNLELELTESLVMDNPHEANKRLLKLKEKGFSLAMDDFGTGYSSLAYLNYFPFDMIKIDQSFIHQLGNSEEADAIVRAMLQLAKALQMRVVAEGVEDQHQRRFLEEEGCDEIQGFWFSRPLRAGDFVKLLQTQPA